MVSDVASPDAARRTTSASTRVRSARATRVTPPRWLDLRLVLGVLLVLLSVVAGARVFASADRFSRVYVAAHDLVPGEQVASSDLSVGRVRLDGQSDYYVAAAAAPPIGYVVRRFVGAHEFVPLGALAPSGAGADTRLVTVPVQPGHLPNDLGHGDLVDVYVTAKAAAGAAVPPPVLVLSAVAVDDREGGARTFSGDSTLAVVLDVPADRVAEVVHAVESGTIDLVRLPRTAAQAAPSAASTQR